MATSTVAPQINDSNKWYSPDYICSSTTFGYIGKTSSESDGYYTNLFSSAVIGCATNLSFPLTITPVGSNDYQAGPCSASSTVAGQSSSVKVYFGSTLVYDTNMGGSSGRSTTINAAYTGGNISIVSYISGSADYTYFGYKITLGNLTLTYNNDTTQTPTFTSDPSVAGSTSTSQTWAKPNNSVALSCSANPMTCPSGTVYCEWKITKSGSVIYDQYGFNLSTNLFTSAGIYTVDAILSNTLNSNTTTKTVTITISAISETKLIAGSSVSDGITITKYTGITTTYAIQYNTTYEDFVTRRIYVNGTRVVNVTSTSNVSYNLTISSNSTTTIRFESIEWLSGVQVIDTTNYLTVDGILQGTGSILYNGQPITNITGRVPNYTPMDITMSGITGYDGTATYTWSVVPSDMLYSEISDETITSCTFTPFDTTKTYVLTYSITSYGTTKTATFDAGVAISCYKGVITSFTLDRYEGSTTDEFTTINTSYIPNEDPQPTITSVWKIYDSGGIEVPSSDVTIISGSMTSENFVFSMDIPGTFTVTLVSSSSGYEDGTYSRTIQIGLVLDISLGAVSRYSIALDNGGVVAILNRRCRTQFSGLVYMKSLNQTGSATFRVIGANNLTKVVGLETVSATSDLMRVGTRVTIIDNMVPIWMGVISSCTEVNQNFFSNIVTTKVFELECDESIKQLSFDYVPLLNTGTVNGTIPEIVSKIIDSSNIGVVSDSLVNYAISIETTSRLAALDSLSNQLGWRYRCRPEILQYYQDISCASDTTYSIATGSDTRDGCIAVIYDSEGGSGYRIGYIENFTVGIEDTFTFSQRFDTNDFDSTSTSLKVSIFGTYLIDYKPTYYQEYIPVMYKVNQYAQNVTDLSNAKDKYGEVSVYGVGYSGEHLASNMRAWMVVNPDYTIDKSARIATSYDSSLDSISKIDTVVGATTPTKSFGRYNLVLNGWSFPTTINSNYVPTVFYSNLYESSGTSYRHLRKIELTYDSDECPDLTSNPRFFYDQNNNKKTAYTISVDLVDTNVDGDGVHLSNVISSFIPMTNVVFNRVVLAGADGRDGTYWLPAVDEAIRIGDMHATVNNKNATLETLIFNWDVPSVDKVNGVDAPWDDTDTPTPHGHMTDVLVMDDSMTVITDGNYDNPVPSSPKYNYPTINQTVLGPEGYSLMELERLACRYIQYGSNYSDRGSCRIPLPAFRRQDYNIGGYRIPMVGDRIAFQKANVNNATTDADYTLQNYELQSYKVDTDKMICEVKYGMPFVMLGDVLYNMLSNSGMSILPSDSEDNV